MLGPTDLKINEYYKATVDDGNSRFGIYIFQEAYGSGNSPWLIEENEMFDFGTLNANKNSSFVGAIYEYATLKEITHLNQCIEANKYVKYRPKIHIDNNLYNSLVTEQYKQLINQIN